MLESLKRGWLELFAGQSFALDLGEEVPDEIGYVFDAFTQRRQAQRHDIKPEEQILAEQSLLDEDAQVLVGGRDDAHIGLDRSAPAHRRLFAVLQHAQELRLRFHRHVADLIEEERTAFGLFEAARAAGIGAGERTLLVAEQFGLDEVARDRCHVDGHEWTAAALAVIVKRPRDQLFAGPGLARDHHREIGLHQAGEYPVDFLHRGRAADQRNGLEVIRLYRRARALVRLRQRPADDPDEFLEIERLRKIFVGAPLGRAHRGHERVLGAHDDHRKLRPQLLDARQEVESVLVGHHDVGDDEVALPLTDPAPEGSGIAGRADFITCARQRLVEHGADCRIVVGNQNVSSGHWHPSSGSVARLGGVAQEHGHEHTKDRTSRLRLAFDNPAVIADDLGYQREAEPRSGRFRRHEGVEEVGQQVLGNAGTVVLDAEFERQRYARLAAWQRQAHAWPKRGRKPNLAVDRILADRLGRVLYEIEEDLDELIAIAEHGRQRRIVVLDELDVPRHARMSEALHVLEHGVDIHGFALDRPLVGEHFHAVDQLHNAVGLVAD